MRMASGWRVLATAVGAMGVMALGAGCRAVDALGVMPGRTLTLAQGGRTEYVIVAADGATAAEATAATELATYLGRITGATFPVVKEAESTALSRRVFVGWTEFARAQALDGARLGEEEWQVRTVGRDLVVTGGRPRGTLYGVYRFIEKDLGCHWLDESTEVVPKSPHLALGRVSRRGEPAFRMRAISGGYYAIDGGLYGKDEFYRARNLANGSGSGSLGANLGFAVGYGSPGGCHTFGDYAKNFPADHPEYLSMNAAGKRIGAVDGSGPGGICLMHPEVRRLILERLRGFIEADRERCAKAGVPPPRVYDISQNDNHWMCQCPECKAMSAREGSESGPLIDFINTIADGIRAEYPDVWVQTFAYSITEQPPKTLKPGGNVIIRVAELNAEWGRESDLFHPLTHPANRAQLERLRGWSKIASNLAEWDYWIQYSPNDKFPTPYAPIACIPPDLETFLQNGVKTVYVECEAVETTSFYALKRWLGFQLLQDPRQPAAPLLQTFMSGYYGLAAAKMTEYLHFMEVSMAAVPANLSAMKNYDRPYLTLAFYLTCERLLDEAEALCATDAPARLHVRRERVPVDAGLYYMWPQLTRDLPAGQTLPCDRDALLQRYERYRLEQMAAFRPPAGLAKGKTDLAKEIAGMREVTAIEKRTSQPPPRARVPRLPDTAAQGDPGKVDWARAVTLAPWYTAAGRDTDQRINARLVHDGRYLYLRLDHVCDPAKLSSNTDQVWSGDEWELFFAAQRAPPYRQLGFNARGDRFAYEWEKLIGHGKPKDWPSGAKIVSPPQTDRWVALVAIPLANVLPGGVAPGRPLYANVCRNQPAHRRLLMWGPAFDDNFHVLNRLPELTLE